MKRNEMKRNGAGLLEGQCLILKVFHISSHSQSLDRFYFHNFMLQRIATAIAIASLPIINYLNGKIGKNTDPKKNVTQVLMRSENREKSNKSPFVRSITVGQPRPDSAVVDNIIFPFQLRQQR